MVPRTAIMTHPSACLMSRDISQSCVKLHLEYSPGIQKIEELILGQRRNLNLSLLSKILGKSALNGGLFPFLGINNICNFFFSFFFPLFFSWILLNLE